jgi:ABC-2 type transport system permease protein
MTDASVASQPRPTRHTSAMTTLNLSYQVVLRQLTSRGRIIGLSLLALIAPLAGWALGRADASLDDSVNLVASVGLGLVLPIVSLVFGGAALGDLREDKTLVYLWLRPMDRWPIVVGAALAAATLTAPITLVSIALAAFLTDAGNGIVSATLLATVVGLVVYVCVFTLFGVWLKRFIVWGLAYILIWEGFIAQAGPGVARVAMRAYTRSILVERTGADLELADYSLATGIIVPLVVAVAALALASWRLSHQDVD